jgi:hypothetical protein
MQEFGSLLLFGLLAALALNFVYARALGKACARAKEGQLQINGAVYKNVTQLCSDIGFNNALWNGKAIDNSGSDAELLSYLSWARVGLRWGNHSGVRQCSLSSESAPRHARPCRPMA